MVEKGQNVTLLVGHSDELLKFHEKVKASGKVLGAYCRVDASLPDGLARLGDVSEVVGRLEEDSSVSQVYCSMTGVPAEQVCAIKSACKIKNIGFGLVLPLLDDLDGHFVRRQSIGGSVLAPAREPLTYLHNRLLKRLFDLLLTVFCMLTVFPLIYLFKLVGIKRREHAPSLVKKRSCGPDGKPFNCMSFRFEERSLARLLNVLTGSMSLVGPDCYPLDEGDTPASLPKHLERKKVKSGLTGWARVNKVDEAHRLDADIYYVENWSLWLDVKILLKSLF